MYKYLQCNNQVFVGPIVRLSTNLRVMGGEGLIPQTCVVCP